MKQLFIPGILIYCLVILTSCEKDGPGTPPVTEKCTISNLVYTPSSVIIRPSSPTFFINGTIDFTHADGGVAMIRLTTSAGADMQIVLPANSQSSGRLSGIFEVATPAAPTSYTFQIWIIDNKGNNSNKLTGSIQLVTDPGGINWQMQLTNFAWPMNKIIWTNSNFTSVGEQGFIYRTANGTAWATPSSPTNNALNGLVWTGTMYVAVGDKGTILNSANGVDWIQRAGGAINDPQLKAVAWNGSTFIAVGWNSSTNTAIMDSSTDGIHWSRVNFTVPAGILNGITSSGSQFAAVGQYYTNGRYQPLVLTSPNGTNWTNRSQFYPAAGILSDIIYADSKFIAVGSGLTASSVDGSNWVAHVNPELALNGVAYSGSAYAGVGNGIFSSADAITWTRRYPDDALGYPLKSVAWSGLQFMAVGKMYSVLVSP